MSNMPRYYHVLRIRSRAASCALTICTNCDSNTVIIMHWLTPLSQKWHFRMQNEESRSNSPFASGNNSTCISASYEVGQASQMMVDEILNYISWKGENDKYTDGLPLEWLTLKSAARWTSVTSLVLIQASIIESPDVLRPEGSNWHSIVIHLLVRLETCEFDTVSAE